MTDARDILANLEQHPESEILAAMLVDALIEERGMLRSEADRAVWRARISAFDVIHLKRAADLLRANGPAKEELHREVRKLVGLAEGDCYTLVLVTGEDPPKVGVLVEQLPRRAIGPGLAIAVPAGWVMIWHRRNNHPLSSPKRKR